MDIIISIIHYIIRYFNFAINWFIIKRNKVACGNITINGIVKICGKGSIHIGDRVILNSGIDFNPIGGMTRMIIASFGGSIIIGNNVGISNSALISEGEGIYIEDDVLIGGSCKIYDTDFHSLNYNERIRVPDLGIKKGKVVIKKGAFIGAHSVILKNVTVGEYSIVGAGSVVTKDIPDGEIWAGNPAIFIRKID